jgi:hypothetical protein
VPTKRRRHAITETPPVEAALDELRRELGGERVDLGELVILGAAAKLEALRDERGGGEALRRSLAARVRARRPLVDRRLADEEPREGGART